MHRRSLIGCSALALALFALDSTPAAACGWSGCGSGYYSFRYAPPVYGYYAPPAYAYAPPSVYYAPPAYAYAYAPPVYNQFYDDETSGYVPTGYYAVVPNYGVRGGYMSAGYRGGYAAAAYYRGRVYGGRVGRVVWRR